MNDWVVALRLSTLLQDCVSMSLLNKLSGSLLHFTTLFGFIWRWRGWWRWRWRPRTLSSFFSLLTHPPRSSVSGARAHTNTYTHTQILNKIKKYKRREINRHTLFFFSSFFFILFFFISGCKLRRTLKHEWYSVTEIH